MMKSNTTLLLLVVMLTNMSHLENLPAQTWQSAYVYYAEDGTLSYTEDSLGNRIPDFSHVGYKYGDAPIPYVEAVVELFPESTNAERLQAVIDSVAGLPMRDNGYRGAIELQAGIYELNQTIRINHSGIVLRGSGDGKKGSILRLKGSEKRPLIHIQGTGQRTILEETEQFITEAYVPVGRRYVVVEDASEFVLGDEIVIRRPATQQWIEDIGMDTIPPRPDKRPVFPWDPEEYHMHYERVITNIQGDTLHFRNPLVLAIDRNYAPGSVMKFEYPGRVKHVGVEQLRLESDYAHEIDENHGWDAIFFDGVEHSWVQYITAQFFGYSAVSIEKNSKHITVQYATNLMPKSRITGGRRYSFNVDGELNLVKHCRTLDGRHDVVTGSRVAGPNVFYNCVIRNANNDAGPHHRWATGTLYDTIDTDGELNIQNRGNRGSGHGWAGVNHVVWNSKANTAVVQNPIGSGVNYAIGFTTKKVDGFSPMSPDGIWEGHNKKGLYPGSLYMAQLNERERAKRQNLKNEIISIERAPILSEASLLLDLPPQTITSFISERSAGSLNDYYSEGTYWWPNPDDPDGPYIRRDGETNPNNFDAHRLALEDFSYAVGVLLSAYLLQPEQRYLDKVMEHLDAWFVSNQTKMNPHLRYAQAIKGISEGRGIGIIDTGHLIDVARVVELLDSRHLVSSVRLAPIKQWFGDYLKWLHTHPNGLEEMNWRNNHGTWWHAQAAAFARVTGNNDMLDVIRQRVDSLLIPNQITDEGIYRFEVARTKPYAYSQYNLEGFTLLSLLLSDSANAFLPIESKRLKLLRSISFMKPYVLDKSKWPYSPDVSEWESQPNRFMFFPLYAYYENDADWIAEWGNKRWPELSTEDKRNLSAKNILLWLDLIDQNPVQELTQIESNLVQAEYLTNRDDLPTIYFNPILPGFNPDPSITMRDSTYYLTTSTFEYFPGLPIYESKDLVHWSLIGHAIHRTDQLVYGDVTNSRGIFAPSFKYHDGKFYIATRLIGTPEKKGSFIVSADNPEGPWSDPIWLDEAGGIDPSLFFDDDGTLYLLGNLRPEETLWNRQRIIWLRAFDLEKKVFLGEQHTLLDAGDYYQNGTLDGGFERGVNNFEGPHLYKKNGYYYLLIAHGGTEEFHAVSIFRSKEITGPYESNPANPILTHRDLDFSHPITSTGHASLIQDTNDDQEWWMVYHGKRPYGLVEDPYYGSGRVASYPLGRETMLSPVDWSGEWPRVNPDGSEGRAERKHMKKGLAVSNPWSRFVDPFTKETLDLRWNFIRIPTTKWYHIDHEPGELVMNIRPEKIQDRVNPSFIGTRMEQINFTFRAKITFKPEVEGEEAGLIALREQFRHLSFSIKRINGEPNLVVAKQEDENSEVQVLYQRPAKSSNYIFEVQSDKGSYTFRYRVDEEATWTEVPIKVDGSFLGMDLGGGRFTGSYIGLFGTSNGFETASELRVDWTDLEFRKPPLDD